MSELPVERPVLTQDKYARAERREGIQHPVIDVIDAHLLKISELNVGFAAITGNQPCFDYVAENYGFLADAIADVGSYTLSPEDLIAIWSRAREVFPSGGHHGRAVAGMITGAYIIQELENPYWLLFPRAYLETDELPKPVTGEKESLAHMIRRINDISDSLDEINLYVYGAKESGLELGAELWRRSKAGDTGADKELEELIAREKERSTPLIASLQDSFNHTVGLHKNLIERF